MSKIDVEYDLDRAIKSKGKVTKRFDVVPSAELNEKQHKNLVNEH